MTLSGAQKKYLRGLAHSLKPVVFIGQKGMTGSVMKAFEEALNRHELIKLKFKEFKEKEEKQRIIADIVAGTGADQCGMIGHTAIFYRRHKDPEKRKIQLPS